MTKRRVHRALKALGMIGGGYALLCIVARLWYPSVLFPAPRLARPPAGFDARRGTQSIDVVHPDGSKTLALWLPPAKPDARVVVVFHGNGESVFDELPIADWLAGQGFGAMLVEYRGYGLVAGAGTPSEAKMYEDAEASLEWLYRQGIARERIVLWGYSLGTGVAIEMAKRRHGARLALFAPFTSIVDVGKRFAPFLPVRWVLADHFDSIDKCSAIAIPTIVVHGENDELVPVDMGRRIGAAIAGSELIVVGGGTHTDLLVEVPRHSPPSHVLFERLASFLQR